MFGPNAVHKYIYALAVTKNLGLGCNYWPCCAGMKNDYKESIMFDIKKLL